MIKHKQFVFSGDFNQLLENMNKRLILAGYETDIDQKMGAIFIIEAETGSIASKCFGLASKYKLQLSYENGKVSLKVEDAWLNANFAALILGFFIFIPWITALIGFLGNDKKLKKIVTTASKEITKPTTANPNPPMFR
ncbi:MAG: hypothetical protein Q4C70_02390 [Planctomycetia bacterium]|nr:hypothetical protein [Planctomycetia bacterium]